MLCAVAVSARLPAAFAGVVRPAGQTTFPELNPDMTFSPTETGGTVSETITPGTSSTSGGLSFSNPNQIQSGPATGFTITPGATPGSPDVIQQLTPAQQLAQQQAAQRTETALFGAIGGVLNTAGTDIAAILASNNQVQIAQLQSQTSLRIAQLMSEAQQAQAQGNLALAQQRAAQANAAQQAMVQLGLAQPPAATNTGLYVVLGVVALGLVGAVVYALSGPRARASSTAARATRSRTRSARR